MIRVTKIKLIKRHNHPGKNICLSTIINIETANTKSAILSIFAPFALC